MLLCSSCTMQCCLVAGNSGGPLLDSSGRLIGVVSVEYTDKQYMHHTRMACLWKGPESLVVSRWHTPQKITRHKLP